MFSGIFNGLNLSFHTPLKDTCNVRDSLEIKMQDEQSKPDSDAAVVQDLQRQKELHLRKAEAARDDIKAYQVQAFCASDKGYMHVWDETLFSRGSQEVVPGLLHYLTTCEMACVIAAFFDEYGGQNRNFNMALSWIHVTLRDDIPVEQTDHTFLESGHPFGPYDSDFADIERKTKRKDVIYTPKDWYGLIEASRVKNKFTVTGINTHITSSAARSWRRQPREEPLQLTGTRWSG